MSGESLGKLKSNSGKGSSVDAFLLEGDKSSYN